MNKNLNWWDKFGYFSLILVSFIVGLWNYFVALASVRTYGGVVGFLFSIESLFLTFVAIYMISVSLNKLGISIPKKKAKVKS